MIKIFMNGQCLKKITGSKLWQFLFPKLAKKKVIIVKSEFPKELIMADLKSNTVFAKWFHYTDSNIFKSPSKKMFEGVVKSSSFSLSINKEYDASGLRKFNIITRRFVDAHYNTNADIEGSIKSDGEGSLLELKITQPLGYYFFVALRLLFGVAIIGAVGLIVLSCIIGLYEILFMFFWGLALLFAFFVAIDAVLKKENMNLEKMEKLFLKRIEGKKIADVDSGEKGNDA
jgi:hypothetical protein